MRLNKKSILHVALICTALFTLSSCKKDAVAPALSGAEQTKLLLVGGTWSIQSVQVDGTDQSALFSGLTVSFTSNGFTASNGEPVWPASGSWTFADDTGKTINRGDGLSINVDEVTANALSLTLIWDKTTLGPGRIESVKGTHVFLFGK